MVRYRDEDDRYYYRRGRHPERSTEREHRYGRPRYRDLEGDPYEPPGRYGEDDRGYFDYSGARDDYYRERDYEPFDPDYRHWERRGASRSHLRCRDIMTREITVADRNTTLEQVAQMMRDEDTGVIPVVERAESEPENGRSSQGKLVGLITDRDIVIRTVADGKDPRTVRAEEVMTGDVHTAQPNDRVIDVIRKMGDKQVRRIPVVTQDGYLRGIISMADVALETEEDRELAAALEEISSGASFWSKILG